MSHSLAPLSRVNFIILVSLLGGSGPSLAQPTKHVLKHDQRVGRLAFSPDSKLLATESTDGIALWDVRKGKVVGLLKLVNTGMEDFAFNRDGKRLVVTTLAANSSALQILNVANGRVELIIVLPERTLVLAVSADGKRAATGFGKAIQVWDLVKGKEVLKILSAHPRGATCLSFSPDGTQLASGGDDPEIKIWDITNGRTRLVIPAEGRQGHWNRIAYSPDGAKIASAGIGYRISELKGGKELINAGTRGTEYRALSFNPTGKWIAVGGNDNVVSIFHTETGKLVAELRGHEHDVNAVAFSRDGKYLASASSDRTVRIWDLKQLK